MFCIINENEKSYISQNTPLCWNPSFTFTDPFLSTLPLYSFHSNLCRKTLFFNLHSHHSHFYTASNALILNFNVFIFIVILFLLPIWVKNWFLYLCILMCLKFDLGFSEASVIQQLRYHVGWWKRGEGVGSLFFWSCHQIQNCSWDH
jgi:hypothetical protein